MCFILYFYVLNSKQTKIQIFLELFSAFYSNLK